MSKASILATFNRIHAALVRGEPATVQAVRFNDGSCAVRWGVASVDRLLEITHLKARQLAGDMEAIGYQPDLVAALRLAADVCERQTAVIQ
jgi:hypothetical protein